ncbi:MAG: FAD-binding oxidoreductase [Piscirickettsiaceae bacterium CG_4_9_14_3_um_filter_43_564]|nr:FAD-binding oxidoreductase [Thiomicrospira sp.]OIP95623.1 MAG: FAD-binding oxidoreductase [Thiomicrospira sp. CG2_30_44_34]PIQ04561.1 MAG: FAD-binding oxidoreductase [Piscirickettsiaceae bacterium CG18_big_fil_WC_8_21_14_2_50_44_103]PIU39280.1 MAG: FAD-binding oxidoreductase [Piscirickettsiaceae bacterium CG07_land_8_20_14_0_80_44_28]PIW78500.1 MAG: FAD-binding oxidoreductase [Piscirickettsiaceae bacterium CG_4_8_14_3_um_filter_44_38]PIX77997.1 MAG: FAD-binding oxidoreductase [Pisciricketts
MISTDASVYEIFPEDFLYPKDIAMLQARVQAALKSQQPITMRAGGTSLGGQAIGSGVLIDISKHLTHILDYRPEMKEVDVEPGVIQDDLNDLIKQDHLRFAPDTSTSNRAMIGGMIGNNSCGSYSVYYGTTRDHVKSVEVILADGNLVQFEDLSAEALHEKLSLQTLEGTIYRTVIELLESHGQAIVDAFPDPSIIRRTTGYALDVLYRDYQPFNPEGKPFNLTPLICGSEGTLGVITKATLKLVDLPKHRQLFCAHFDSIYTAMQVVPQYLAFKPAAIELIDKATLDGTKNNAEQTQNRFWVQQDPEAVLVVELFDEDAESLQKCLKNDQAWMLQQGAYACPIIDPQDSSKVWNLRKAGLGLLMGKPTRDKAVAVIEDAAVPVADLPAFYQDTQALMAELDIGCVYYGHASVGLIHVRPEMDLATDKGKQLFQTVAERSAALVKKYRGAISGEHGDGRIRAPFIKDQVGDAVYQHLVTLKQTFDPQNLFNPGVIIGDTPITENLRANRQPQQFLSPGYNWQKDLSLMDAVEKCNGAGACRKSAGNGVMCPSYQATREENYSTRGRSNLLRRALTEPNPLTALKQPELQDALSLCLGCKACKSECPASVDMARLKSEVLYQVNDFSLSGLSIKFYGAIMKLGAIAPGLYNSVQNLAMVKWLMAVDARRTLPKLANQSIAKWLAHQPAAEIVSDDQQTVWLLLDLYVQYQEPNIAQAAIQSLQALGLNVKPILLTSSPRALLSQGLLKEAKTALAEIQQQLNAVTAEDFVVGIEPSDTLVWRDEAIDLVTENDQAWSFSSVLLFEELILKLNETQSLDFQPLRQTVWLHVHCHQKSLAKPEEVVKALQLIPELRVNTIQSGCCGMSGEFGYKNYEVSHKIASQTLLPTLEKADNNDLVVATGTSCRHQIEDFADKQGLHPAEIFWMALNRKSD